jgi:Hint domain-containing protein
MTVYYIVANGTNPLGPFDIEAGSVVNVQDGDTFIFSADADDNIKFEAASGQSTPVDFSIEFNSTNTSGQNFDVQIQGDLTANIDVAASTNIGGITISAAPSDGTTLTVGDGAEVSKFTGSTNGADDLTIGNNVTVNDVFDLGAGDNSLTIGDSSEFQNDIITDSGSDTILIGDGNTFAGVIKMDLGVDSFTAGDNNTFDKYVDSGDGNDSVTFGNNNFIADFGGGTEGDVVNIGFIDSSVAQKLDGVSDETGTSDFDTIRIDVSDDAAGFEAALLNNGYNLQPDGTWIADGSTDLNLTWNNVEIKNVEKFIICFTRGTMIETQNGEVAIEDLSVGDMVRTLDSGYQPIRWIRSRTVPGSGNFAPIEFKAGAVGNRRSLSVSPQHRMLITSAISELYFGTHELLATAKSLVNDKTIRKTVLDSVEYFHILFDKHEIIFAEGALSESFFPGEQSMSSFDDETRQEIFELFPELRSNQKYYGKTARMVLKSREIPLLTGMDA